MKLSLDGSWQLYFFPQGDFSFDNPQALFDSDLTPIHALVPGNVELDLQRAGLLPEPYEAANIRLLRPCENDEWWYVRSVVVPAELGGQGCELVFEGLDTFGTVWVNGQKVGESANMLVEQRFDVAEVIRPGEANTIVIRIRSAVQEARRYSFDANLISWEHRIEGLYTRKAPHMWGWDILPRLVSAGLWRSVSLQNLPENAFEQLYYWTIEATQERAVLGVRFQFRTPLRSLDGLVVRFQGVCGESAFVFHWPVEFVVDGCEITILNPKLWWPAGYGEPNLYILKTQLCLGEQVLCELTDRIGLRKLFVDRTELAGQAWLPEPASSTPARLDTEANPESHFLITVNGQAVMIKGTNWVPLDALHSRDASRLETALAMVADLGCNMIRCWGGNVYEADAFYDWCDAHGVLVWQDLAFACCLYPQSEAFLAVVRREIEQVARRLRNHACLALWCGDNEIDMLYLSQGLDPQTNRLTREVIPQVLNRCDPYRAVLPSSPYAPPAVLHHPSPWQATPEQHLWGPRGYYKGPFYTRHSAHFIGEIGYHGCPSEESLRKFLSPEHLWPCKNPDDSPNDEWQVHAVYHWNHHAIDRDRIQLMANQIRELFGIIPEGLQDFILASQITQAEAKKFFIESTRLRKWQTSGILWWNLLDGWPQFSDAVVDYYFVKKLAYHYIWRSQRSACLFLGEAGTGKYLPLVASNDTLKQVHLYFRVWEAGGRGELVSGEFDLPANQNWQIGRIRTFASDQRMFLMEWEAEGESFGNHYLAGTPPFSLEQYKLWLEEIRKLPRRF